MKKFFFALAFSVATLFVTFNASAQAFKNGDKLLNIGIGVNSYYSGGVPLNASLEFGVVDNISVGPNIDYLSYNYSGFGKFTALYLGVRGSYHFSELLGIEDDKFDVYGGAGLGYRSFKWKDLSYDLGGSYGSGVYFGLHVGAKYYFAPTVGVFAELGATGATNVRLGVGFKF